MRPGLLSCWGLPRRGANEMHCAKKWTGHVFLAALLLAAGAPAAHATVYHWTGAGTGGNTATDPADLTTQWNRAANWQEGKVPGAADGAYVSLNNAGSVNLQSGSIGGFGMSGASLDGALHIGSGVNFTATVVSGAVGVGDSGTGRVVQTGGSLTANGLLRVGSNGTGVYLLQDGTLNVAYDETIGYSSGTGTFTQTGGTHVVQGALNVGYYDATGVLNMGGGTLTASTLEVYGNGTVNVTSTQATITIGSNIIFYDDSTFTAVPGTTLHMGAYPRFENYSSNEKALSGLENVTLVDDGVLPLRWMRFEVAGTDYGAVPEGFRDNFALGGLVIGAAYPTDVRLFDDVDNGNRASSEALYVHSLTIKPGSTLDLRGYHLYYDGTLDNQGTITGGSPQFVPEPATVGILVAGLAGLLIRTGRRA
jgi:hypothetical protein